MLGNYQMGIKRFLFGDFKKTYRNGYIDFQNDNKLLRSLKILDYADQYL